MKAFLIPGNGEDLKDRDYKSVLELYKKLGYEPEFIPIIWRYRTIDNWIEQVRSKLSDKDIANSVLSGFSFGSMIAVGMAAQVNPKKLLLFSLSPYFKEDQPYPEEYHKWHGKRQLENFKNFSIDSLAKRIKSPTILFLGSKEKDKYPDMWHRSSDTNKKIAGSKLVLVEGVGHDVADPKYIAAIREELA